MRVQDIIAEKEIDEAPAGMFKQMGRKIGAKALGAIGAKGKAAELGGAAEVGDQANELKTAFRGYLGKTGGNAKQVEGPQLAAFLKSKGYPNMHLKDVQGVMTPKQVDQAIMQAAQDAAKADGDPGKTAPTAGAAKGGTAPTDANKDGKDDATGKPMPVDKNKDGKDDATGEPMPAADDTAASPAAKKIEFTPDQPVMFPDSKTGELKPATVVGKSLDNDENKVSVKGSKGQTFNIPRASLVDPKTKKPFTPGKPGTTSSAPATGGAEIPAEMQKKIDSLNPEQKKELASLL